MGVDDACYLVDSSQSRPALVVPGFSLLSGARLVTDRLLPAVIYVFSKFSR